MGLDKIDFSLNTEGLLDNVQNFFSKGFSDDSDLISEKSLPTQPNGVYKRHNYPNSTGTQRRKLPVQPPASHLTFSTLFNSTPDKNSSTTSEHKTAQSLNLSIVRTPHKKTSERITDTSFISSNYSSTSPPPNLSRRDSIQSSLYSETGPRPNHKTNQNYSQIDLPKGSNQEEDDLAMDILSYNSRPQSHKSREVFESYKTNKNNSNENLKFNQADTPVDNQSGISTKFFESFAINSSSGFRRPFFFKHTGSTPRDRWLRAYEFVKHQLPNVS